MTKRKETPDQIMFDMGGVVMTLKRTELGGWSPIAQAKYSGKLNGVVVWLSVRAREVIAFVDHGADGIRIKATTVEGAAADASKWLSGRLKDLAELTGYDVTD